MTQITHDAESVQGTKSQQEIEWNLWAEYLVLLARELEGWRLFKEAWHDYVCSGLRDAVKDQQWNECIRLHDEWRDRAGVAYQEWKKVAYPLYGIPLSDEDNQST